MPTNPYQSPAAAIEHPAAVDPNRQRARSSVRFALLILLLPAIFNYYAFDTLVIGNGLIHPILQAVYRTTNVLGIVVASSFIWFLGLPLLERAARAVRFLFSRDTAISAWQDVLYTSLNPAMLLAIPAAILWAIWVTGIYYLGFDFYAISYAVGVPAHVLAACLYLPLLFRWFKISQSGPENSMP